MHAQHAAKTPTTPRSLLADALRIGDPVFAGALTIFPLLGSAGRVAYRTLAEALEGGGKLRELPSADVNRLLFDAPDGPAVLLYAGEEVLGAKQNRVVNATLLAAGSSHTVVPVSCVEEGRWTPGGERSDFAVSDQIAFTALRRKMTDMVRTSRSSGRGHATDQSSVWREVEHRTGTVGVRSTTGAMTAMYEHHDRAIDELAANAAVLEGQLGMIVFLGAEFAALDLVSSHDVWRRVHPRLLRSHALEALTSKTTKRPSTEAAARALDAVLDATADTAPAGIGLGTELRFSAEHDPIEGAGLLAEGELVQLSAFAAA